MMKAMVALCAFVLFSPAAFAYQYPAQEDTQLLILGRTPALVNGAVPTTGTTVVLPGPSPIPGNITQVGGSSFTLGQKTMANSIPFAIASDQSSIPYTFGQPAIANIVKARVSLTDTTETTVLSAVASTCLDIIFVGVYNHSTANTAVEIRDDTAGGIELDPFVAANGGGANFTMFVYWPQDTANKNWTAKATTTPSGGGAKVTVTLIAVKRAC